MLLVLREAAAPVRLRSLRDPRLAVRLARSHLLWARVPVLVVVSRWRLVPRRPALVSVAQLLSLAVPVRLAVLWSCVVALVLLALPAVSTSLAVPCALRLVRALLMWAAICRFLPALAPLRAALRRWWLVAASRLLRPIAAPVALCLLHLALLPLAPVAMCRSRAASRLPARAVLCAYPSAPVLLARAVPCLCPLAPPLLRLVRAAQCACLAGAAAAAATCLSSPALAPMRLAVR